MWERREKGSERNRLTERERERAKREKGMLLDLLIVYKL